MRRSADWLYGSSGAKRRRWQSFAGLAVACLLIACAVFAAVRYVFDGWEGRATEPESTTVEQSTTIEPATAPPEPPAVKVKGLYVTAWSAGMEDRLVHYIALCDATEINALVIDVKDDRGQLTFANAIESAARATNSIIPDIAQVMALLKAHGIYAIARVVCFKDPLWSGLHPELAIRNTRGGVWKDADGAAWLDPYNEASWAYLAAVAREAARAGFDEIQLDYVRFPTAGNLKDIDYGSAASEKPKAQAVADFLAHIRQALAGTGTKLSVDIFGITAIHGGDYEDIGQDPVMLSRGADWLCPMVYPSHFANKRQNGAGQVINDILYEAPDLQPYEIVYNTLLLIRNRLRAGANPAGVRPWLQDFTASYLGKGYFQEYTARQVRDQIQAVYDAGFSEWILWNAAGAYSEDALLPE